MSESLNETAAGASDSPTTNDLLNYKRFAVPIAERIASADENSTPMTIGIFGEWGMGKTSFLMMVDEALADRGVTPVWFNAWKYEHEENLWSALLQTILSKAKVNGPWLRRVSVKLRIFRDSLNLRSGSWHVAKLILIFVLRLVLFLTAITVVFSWSKTDIVAFLQRYIGVLAESHALLAVVLLKVVTSIFAVAVIKPESLWKLFSTKLSLDFSAFKKKRSYQARIAFLDDFTEEFRRIVRLIGMGKPLVVIIDDLDRCLPEKAIQVLEAIKLFLDVKGCVFLLAVDQEVIESAIAVKYKDILAAGRTGNLQPPGLSTFLGENYFEKIIQLPFALPPLAKDDLGRLVSHLWRDEKTKACADIFATGLPPNPRKIKRNLQTFFLLHQLAKSRVEAGIIKPSLLAKIVIIQNQFREIYRELATTPTLMEALEDYFRGGSQSKKAEPDDAATLDPILTQKLETYAVRYPRLREIFIQEIEADDTFRGAPIGDYIFFVKAVTEGPITPPKIASDERENSVRQYFSYLVQQSKTFPILADVEKSSRWADLDKLFVEPRLAKVSADDAEKAPPIRSSALLKQSARVLVFGSPGTGKTSLLKYLISQTIRGTDQGALQRGTNAPPKMTQIPMLLSANDLTSYGDRSGKGPQDVLKVIESYYSHLNIPITEMDLQSFFEEGRCILFIDGLDEIVEDEYSRVVDFLNLLTSRYPMNQYVVSTRTRGLYRSSPLIGFDLYEILPLSDEQVSEFVSKAVESKDECSELIKFISTNEHVRTLSENPLFLSIIVALYSQTKTLPTSLLGAIDEYVELSLGRWDQIRGIGGRARTVQRQLVKQALAGIALHMHERGVERIRKTDVVDIICIQISATQVEATELLYQLRSHAGLFNEVAEGIYAFVHMMLKEYLAAEAIITKPEPISLVLEHRSDPYWRMAIQFVAGRLAEWNSQEFTRLIDRLIDVKDTESTLLAAESFLMNPMADPVLRQKLITEMQRVRASDALPPNLKMRAKELEKQLKVTDFS